MDLLQESDALALQERVTALVPGAVFVSTELEHGLDPLGRALRHAVRARRPLAEVWLQASDGKLLAEIHRLGDVVDQRSEGDQMVIRARLPERLRGKLEQAGAVVRPA
jgi:GTP-binding protein HflX